MKRTIIENKMKKLFFAICASALAVLSASCQKDEVENGRRTSGSFSLEAAIERPAGYDESRTTLAGSAVSWEVGDAIKLFDVNGESIKMIAQNAGNPTRFVEDGPDSETFDYHNLSCAIYPYSSDASFSEGKINFTTSTQNYVDGTTFGEHANVAVANIANGKIVFKNVFGILRLQFLGSWTIDKIELTDNTGRSLCGSFTVDPSESSPKAVYSGDAAIGKTLTLNVDEKVKLGVSAESFYFVVPAGSFKGEGEDDGGFTATVYGNDALTCVVTTQKSANVVNRSTVRVMPPVLISWLPEGYTEGAYIESYGKEYIIGPECVPANTTIETEFYFKNTTSTAYQAVCGVRSNQTTDDKYHIYFTPKGNSFANHGFSFGLGAKTSQKVEMAYGEWHTAVLNKKGVLPGGGIVRECWLDGSLSMQKTDAEIGTIVNNRVWIFARNTFNCGENPYDYMIGRIRYLVYYDFGGDSASATHKLIPVRRDSDGVCGFYDVVGDKFYTNSSPKAGAAFTMGEYEESL